jgi:hypothetical protein
MKAKITEVKKIVPKQGGQGGGQGGEPPKNIEQFGEGPDEPGTEDQPGQEGPEKPGDDKKQDKKSGKGKKGEQGQDDQGKPSKGSGSGSGTDKGQGWEEVDPEVPGASYEVTPWQKPAGKTVIGEVLPAGTLGEGPTDNEKMKEEWKQITTAAESQSQGKIPGGIRAALDRMRAPVIDWKRELETFIDNAISKTRYALPARRFLAQGKAQYGYKRYKEDFECVVIAIDTSGSISDKMVAQFLAEAKAIVDAYSPQDLYVIFCHTSIYRVDHIQPGDPIEVGKLQSGGTEFYPPFKWTQENLLDKGINPSCFIYFTDGEATFPKASEYGIGEYEDRCLWVLLTWNGRPFPDEIPFGGRIDITLPNKDVNTI